jgi:hypothetical protein
VPDNPITRVEQYLAGIAGDDVEVPERPTTRIEEYLARILTNQTDTDHFFGVLDQVLPAEAHRTIYRGKYLGDSMTTAQRDAIQSGEFSDIWLGDYWSKGGVDYMVADFNYWLSCGDKAFTRPHVVVMPRKNMYNAKMNATNITTGGYYGSAMRGVEVDGTFTPYAEGCGLYNALIAFQDAFGDALLTHREYLCNTIEDGKETAGAWFDSIIDLPSEIMMYGNSIRSASPRIATIGKSQLALMAVSPKFINIREYQWLRDVVSAAHFALVDGNGRAYYYYASTSRGVRPVAAVG